MARLARRSSRGDNNHTTASQKQTAGAKKSEDKQAEAEKSKAHGSGQNKAVRAKITLQIPRGRELQKYKGCGYIPHVINQTNKEQTHCGEATEARSKQVNFRLRCCSEARPCSQNRASRTKPHPNCGHFIVGGRDEDTVEAAQRE